MKSKLSSGKRSLSSKFSSKQPAMTWDQQTHTHTHIATAAAAAAFCSLTTKIKSKTNKLECTIALLRSFQHWYTQMQSTAEQTELLSFVGGAHANQLLKHDARTWKRQRELRFWILLAAVRLRWDTSLFVPADQTNMPLELKLSAKGKQIT